MTPYKYLVVRCNKCGRFFPMKIIKSDYKKCPSCGERIRWRRLPRKKIVNQKIAREYAIILNEKKAMDEQQKESEKSALDYLNEKIGK